ncbi:AP-3 complex subunit delta, partial [Coemansia sp. RSA 2603]
LYHLLNSSTNNWMLIKIVKLFASLTPIEPRLAKKLHGPLSQLVLNTSAMSLLYECIHTAVVGDIISVPVPVQDSSGRELEFAELCASKLELFYESHDHNLCYVGLVTLAQLQARRPDLVVNQYDSLVRCLDHPDLSIRMRAIEVASGMATRKTLTKMVKRLMSQLILSNTIALQPNSTIGSQLSDSNNQSDDYAPGNELTLPKFDSSGASLTSAHGSIVLPKNSAKGNTADPADSPEYRTAVVTAILDMCSRQSYANMTNFEWYVATLVDLVYVAGVDVGREIGEKLLDVTIRVRQVREYSVKMVRRLLSDRTLIDHITPDSANAKVLTTAAYILGEYCTLVPTSVDDVQILLPASLGRLDGDKQATFVQAAMKVYTNWLQDVAGYWSSDIWELVRSVTSSVMSRLTDLVLDFSTSAEDRNTPNGNALAAAMPLQVSSRVRQFIEITKVVSMATSNMSENAPPICSELHSLFTLYELNPVSAAAQGKVPVPEGLDLDTPIGDPIPDTSRIVMPQSPPLQPSQNRRRSSNSEKTSSKSHRDRKNDPYYLGGRNYSEKDGLSSMQDRDMADLPDVDDIPVVALDLGETQKTQDPTTKTSKSKKKKSKSGKKHHRKTRVRTPSPPPISVDIVGDEDMPE